MIIDTHAHIQGAEYDEDRLAAIERAAGAGVARIVAIGADMASSRAAVALAEQQAGIVATVGVHPHDAKSFTEADLAELERLAAHPRVRAVGEIGLDFHYDFSPRGAQRSCFRAQLGLAASTGSAVVIHTREAEEEVHSILQDALSAGGIGRVVMHCFLGDTDWARRWLDLGCYLGIGGAVTFKKMEALREAVRVIPMDRLLLETDCPYMTPHPHRGKRNEPAYTALVAQAVAEAKGLPVEEIAGATTANARAVFGEW